MPFLNEDNTEGFLHCLFRQQLSPQDAHDHLLKYLGHEARTIEEINALFIKFEDDTFRTEYPDRVLLVKDLTFTKHSVMEFCDLFQGNFHMKNFTGTSGMKIFLNAVVDELKKRKESEDAAKWNYYTRDFLHGHIRCLQNQGSNQERIHTELKKLTLREVFTLDNVAEVINLDEDVLVKLELDFSEFPRQLIENALNYTNIDSRVTIRRTCSVFHEIENTIDYGINFVHLRFNGGRFQLKSDGKVAEKQYEPVVIGKSPSNYRVYLVHENDNVWMDTGNDEYQFKRLWNVMAHTPRCTIRDFKISFGRRKSDDVDFRKLTKLVRELPPLRVQNVYFYCDTAEYVKPLISKFEHSVLQKIKICCELPRGLAFYFFNWPQFFHAKEFITNVCCDMRSLEDFGHLKFSTFNTYLFDPDQIFKLKNKLLTQPADFREIKFRTHFCDNQYDTINIQLGTFNQRDTEFPRFAEFPYPPPNEKKILKLAVFNEFCWFRGPEWRCGEMEVVENELEINSTREAVLRREKHFAKPEYRRANQFDVEYEEQAEGRGVETTYFNQDVADGLLYGMFSQHETETNAHAKIVQSFGPNFMNIMQVKVLYRRFKEENYKSFCPVNLMMVENYKIKKHSIFGFCKFYDNFDNTRMQGMKVFQKAVKEQLEKKKVDWKFYNIGFIRGYINFLKSQERTREEVYTLVKELTREEMLTMEDITEDLNIEMDKLILKSYQRSFERELSKKITSVHCTLHGKGFRIIVEPEMIEINYDIIALEPGLEDIRKDYIRLIYENGSVWMSRTTEKLKHDKSRFSRAWKSLQQSKSTIENLMMSTSMINTRKIGNAFKEHGQLHVKNSYFYCACNSEAVDYFDSVYLRALAPGVLKRIAIYCDGWVGQDENELFSTEQFRGAEEFIANGRCHIPPDVSFAHLKFGRFKVGWINEAEVMAWKEQLLTKPTDFREIKIKVETSGYVFGYEGSPRNSEASEASEEDFPQENIENLQFDKFPYPEPNQDKFLELGVADNLVVWFRGPGRIPGEMEEVEKEMELNKPFEHYDRNIEKLPMHQGCFDEKAYTLPGWDRADSKSDDFRESNDEEILEL
ncbi:hypothetical protein CAEBREN_21327 [Caenorhabditis brenneri]|uniref:DUF38 domain-containing protein n=1 Tax=Caenorhabditis brenneri TaxID=135651 RepID=G0N899_CAEBE|nr:hypothetical protein CAEBREN_21327 [Caenorhabditis brenneri]